MYRILYCSKNLIPHEVEQQSDVLSRILQTAQKNNAAREITGALLYNSGYFAQVLEGPIADVERTFERIQQDERHGEVTVLDFAETETRDFGNWSMLHVAPQTMLEAAVAGDTLCRAMNTPGQSGHDVLELLRSLVNQDNVL